MYEVAQGKNYAKITLSGSEVAVKFPNAHDVFAVKGENIQAALTAEAVAGADGTYNTADGDGQIIIAHYTHANTLYIKGTGTAIVWGGQAPEACPFKKQAKGGDITVTSLSVTTNGTYTAPSGTAYSPVTVDVQEQPWEPLQDGYSNFWFELTDDTLSPWLNFSAKNSDAVIDWGDGSGEVALDTLTPTHTYSKAGKYVVKVKGVVRLARIFQQPFNVRYNNALKYIELNNEVTHFPIYCYQYVIGLRGVSIATTPELFLGYIFAACPNLEKVYMPSGITEIQQSTFSGDYLIQDIELPTSLTTIGVSAFAQCVGLTSITLPSTVTTLNNTAFSACYSLTEVHCQATTPPTLGTNVFQGLPSNWICYVPVGTGETYKAAAGWSAYADHILEEGQSVTRAMQRKFASDALKAEETEIEEKR